MRLPLLASLIVIALGFGLAVGIGEQAESLD